MGFIKEKKSICTPQNAIPHPRHTPVSPPSSFAVRSHSGFVLAMFAARSESRSGLERSKRNQLLRATATKPSAPMVRPVDHGTDHYII